MTSYCIIPARAGSERFPGKNMALLDGTPLIGHAIRKANSSNCDKVIVTTNDADVISGIVNASSAWKDVRLDRRPEEHSDGKSGRLRDYIAQRLIPKWEIDGGDTIVLLQCTYPFTKTEHINWAIKTLQAREDVSSAQTICIVPGQFHPFNLRRLATHGTKGYGIDWLNPNDKYKAWIQQDQPIYRAFAGVVACWAAEFGAGLDAPFAMPAAFLDVPWYEALDINTPEDLAVAAAVSGRMAG